MLLIKIRRLITLLVIFGSIILLLLIWTGFISIFPLANDSYPYISTVVATIVPTTATFGIAALAIIFLSAQVSAAYGKPSVLRELYRNNDIYILFGFLVINVVGGYIALVFNTDLVVTILETRLLDTLLISAIATVLLILPTIISLIENFDPLLLASKLSAQIRPREVKKYGLTKVELASDEKSIIKYQLITVGLRPQGVDPFRPMHEVIKDSVDARDRVLFGKLFRYMLQPIALSYRAGWDQEGVKDVSNYKSNFPSIRRKAKIDEQVHLTLAIMHYSVKRADNLLREWGNLDIGRHGILTGIGDLIRSLARVKDSEIAIQICLYAILRIEKFYAAIMRRSSFSAHKTLSAPCFNFQI